MKVGDTFNVEPGRIIYGPGIFIVWVGIFDEDLITILSDGRTYRLPHPYGDWKLVDTIPLNEPKKEEDANISEG